ncbi:MAG: hypothetical protein WBV85_06065 [Solirubrobacteraceae bacterium]
MGKPHMGLLAVAAAALMALAFAGPALATKPTGDFVNFGNCPTKTAGVNFCVFGQTNSGEFKIKKTEVPITKTITIQGGIIDNEAGEETWVNAANGAETLSKTPQNVPGGVLKLVAPSFFPEPLKKIWEELIAKSALGANATAELVGKVTISRLALLTGAPDALSLPVRVHLENTFLGSKCYVGSSGKPVNIELTTGETSPPLPNKAIKGSLGEPEFKDEGNLLVLKKNELVNNSFSAPGAEGCGSQILFGIFTGLIDEAVNAEIGLPSAAGNNTAIFKGTLENASAAAVVASEK